ncbi:MAG: hypothetical protein IPO67_22055 [Deltaproteobacteria bacterium]|nr:hypothetical protein [Deltaproteobacteria bacterium]
MTSATPPRRERRRAHGLKERAGHESDLTSEEHHLDVDLAHMASANVILLTSVGEANRRADYTRGGIDGVSGDV